MNGFQFSTPVESASVYFVEQAAQFEGVLPPLSIAVEDSASGVGSANAADMGMIVGYVGASHITDVSAFLSSGPCRDSHSREILSLKPF